MTTGHAEPVTRVIKSKFATANELLEYLAENADFEVSAPIQVDEIARLLRIKVEESVDLDHFNKVGRISLEDDGTARVWINPLENSYIPRKRFTLAHEIGHYCLHLSESRTSFVDDNSSMSRSESYWDTYEFEANNFAAELLMPKKLVTSEGSKIINQYKLENNASGMPTDLFVDAIAKLLKVSTKAMEYRLMNLGVIKKK